MAGSYSNRVMATPSSYAKEHYLYVQEIGTLKSLEPHVSQREKLDSLLFMVVLEGKGQITYHRKTWEVKAGDCVWLDCRQAYAHESSLDFPWSLMWVHFYGKDAALFYQDYLKKENPFIFTPGNTFAFTNTLTLLFREQSHKDSLAELTSHKYLTDIVTLIFTENNKKDASKVLVPDKFIRIRDYLEEHFQENIRLDDLASGFFISKYHLSREYKKLFGVTINDDLTSKRITHAKSFLRFSDLGLEDIAAKCGFQNSGYFIKVFKKEENVTPLQYRKKW